VGGRGGLAGLALLAFPPAVAQRVGCQLMHGQDHIRGPVLRQSRLPGASPHFGAQKVQRSGVEGQIEERRDVAVRWLAYRTVIGHLP
jgi:hypothetical protein